MGNKYRVHEIAKDMGVPSNDVLEILKKYFGKEDYKHMTVLEEREINVVLAHFTRMKQVDSLDEMKTVQEQAKPARLHQRKKLLCRKTHLKPWRLSLLNRLLLPPQFHRQHSPRNPRRLQKPLLKKRKNLRRKSRRFQLKRRLRQSQ